MDRLSAYELLHICQQKLYEHSFRSPDVDLRILVGHSNMMDKLIDSVNYQDSYAPFDRSLTLTYRSTVSHLEPRKGVVGSEPASDSDAESPRDKCGESSPCGIQIHQVSWTTTRVKPLEIQDQSKFLPCQGPVQSTAIQL
ncbi:hypothetical protein ATEIFO6365_0011022500 [Aspergillus terreus]|uniref:Uncharacterized protein n=1 Tax=Aspergillus terreus TaxID=33178 RepID=A0A5M3Z0E2_ASPTE|nr:hypothetical protein ATETN484_0006022500 [Aspergillus terreus]GFF19966.1 hypothetical protein ATEIFO6365_0011022500 [Aspergillus terreus]